MSRFSNEKPQGRHQPSKWQRLLPLVAGIILIGFFGSIYWSSQSYSNQRLMQEFFEPLPESLVQEVVENLPPTDPDFLLNLLNTAEFHFKNNNNPKARQSYEQYFQNMETNSIEMDGEQNKIASWNKIIINLDSQEIGTISKNLNDYIDKYPDSREALNLKRKLTSFWYGWAN